MSMNQSPSASNGIPIAAIRAFHAEERTLYSRMTLSLSMDPSQSMDIIAFWLWIESNGDARSIIRTISSFNDASLISLADVAATFTDALHHPPPSNGGNNTFRNDAIRGIRYYLRTVCFPALGDIRRVAEERRQMEQLVLQMSRTSVDRRAAPPLAGDGRATWRSPVLPEELFNLGSREINNREMLRGSTISTSTMRRAVGEPEVIRDERRAHVRRNHSIPREERMLFVTFSNGYPLTEQELYDFFTRNFGDVESVRVQQVYGKDPVCAYVSFHSLATLLGILGGGDKIKFMTNGKHLWARRYLPKKKY